MQELVLIMRIIISCFYISLKMSILNYFSTAPQDLPNSVGLLLSQLLFSTIAVANAAVSNTMIPREAKKQGPYLKLEEEMKIR